MLKEHVRAQVLKCLGKESRYLLPLRNPPFFGNLSHPLPNKTAQRFSHKSVRVNIYPCPSVKSGGEGWGGGGCYSHREGDRKFWTEVSSAWFLTRGDKDRLNGTFGWKFSRENVRIGGCRSRFDTLEAILRCFPGRGLI